MASKLALAIHQRIQGHDKPHSEACTCTDCLAVIDEELLPLRLFLTSLYGDRVSDTCPVCLESLDELKRLLGMFSTPAYSEGKVV
jgi:hypothetical protein